MSITLRIKNMVCPRCVQSVAAIFQQRGITASVALGEVTLAEEPDAATLEGIRDELAQAGFEWVASRVEALIVDIKRIVGAYLETAGNGPRTKLSAFIKEHIAYDYSYLSDLFSGVEGKSIEQYFIELRIEKVKELIVYDQLSLSEIADRIGFSSVHHLSAQFRKVSGLTPSHFRKLGVVRRRPIDGL